MFGLFKKKACPNCGAAVKVNAKFCPACGMMLKQTAPPPAAVKEPEPETEPAGELPDVGDRLFFGCYQGDDIEWVVLDAKDGRALLFCAYSLDLRPFHKKRVSVTWARSDLREWLNGEFVKEAFSKKEQGRICVTTLKNPGYDGAMGASDTEDKVFLLSVPETAHEYDLPADFNISNYVDNSRDGYLISGYWLRTPAGNSCQAIRTHGAWSSIPSVSTISVDAIRVGVRPAMWIKF